jgi:uncharacterized protein YndB with AHSA1/START domain
VHVRRSIDLDVDVEQAWDALTGHAGLEAWLGGPSTLELVPGGLGVLTDDEGVVHLAEVEHVEHRLHGRRLVLRWVAEGDAPGVASRVELLVERHAEGSRVTVVETALTAAPATDDGTWAQARAERWDGRLDRLEGRLAARVHA